MFSEAPGAYTRATFNLQQRSSTAVTRAVVLLFLAAVGCTSVVPPPNARLAGVDLNSGYRFAALPMPEDDDVFVALTFSGGGSRAAALAYGVLRELQATKLPDGRAMLDEVDLISSVSGGSFTAMHYGLFGTDGFPDFEKSFLRKDVERDLFHSTFLNASSLARLARGKSSRIEDAAAYYDANIFHGKTYADLVARHKRPFIVVNSTELGLGSRFDFTQAQFDPICTDLSQMKVADAVAASSAVPGVFAPLMLQNYSRGCNFQEPAWVEPALRDYLGHLARFREAEETRSLNSGDRPWVHLSDGGVADNLGVRVLLDALMYDDSEPSLRQLMMSGRVKRVVIIVVNAASSKGKDIDLLSKLSSVGTLRRAATIPIVNYTVDSIDQLMEKVRASNNRTSAEGPKVELHSIVVAFPMLPDAADRRFFESIGTNFSLTSEQVDRLIEAGGRLLRTSPEFKKLLSDLSQQSR